MNVVVVIVILVFTIQDIAEIIKEQSEEKNDNEESDKLVTDEQIDHSYSKELSNHSTLYGYLSMEFNCQLC